MADPVKILELSGTDWLKGISVQPYMPVGGLFQTATNFDPFEKVGIYVPTQSESSIGSAVMTDTPIRHIVSYASSTISGASFLYCFGNSNGLYRVRTDNQEVVDISSRINISTNNKGAIKFKNKLVYCSTTTVFAGAIPLPRTYSETILVNGLNNTYFHYPYIGPDRNLYITNKNSVARVTSVSGTANNTSTFLSFEDDVVVRSLADDG